MSELSHHHNHGHHHHLPVDASQTRLLISVGLNLLITLAEVIGGILSGSLSLISDALHNFSDTLALVVSFMARRLSLKKADRSLTFGYRRAEIIGAFINLITLVVIAAFLIKEAVMRFIQPTEINGQIMFIVGSIGLLANLITAILLFKDSKDSLNIKSAFLHIVSDAVSSVGVVLGGWLIIYYQIYFIDPLLTLLISIYILIQSYQMLKKTISILMEAKPENIDTDLIIKTVSQIEKVVDIHHVHIWQLDDSLTCLDAHINVSEDNAGKIEIIKNRVKDILKNKFGIHHSTLEIEINGDTNCECCACD
jgi:cobalt-zinc-cadmium efflux system protein